MCTQRLMNKKLDVLQKAILATQNTKRDLPLRCDSNTLHHVHTASTFASASSKHHTQHHSHPHSIRRRVSEASVGEKYAFAFAAFACDLASIGQRIACTDY